MIIEKTKNYELFRVSNCNRDLNEANVAKLIASIKSRNLLEFRPIIVNANMEIIDGQHRLAAAKALDLEVWYKVDQDSTISDILLLNLNQKNWDLGDYLKYYISQGSEEYKKFSEFVKNKEVDIRQGLRFVNEGNTFGYKNFKSGKFKFPEGMELVNVMNCVSKYDLISSIIKNQKIGGNEIIQRSLFKTALLEILKNEDLDFDIFREKIKINLDKIRLCSSAREYLNMLTDVYNWKNRNPIA